MAEPRAEGGRRGRPHGRRTAAVAIAGGLAPLAAVALMAAYMLGPATDALDLGTALPELSIEQVAFVDGEIRATVRNTGPMPVEVAVADVNDRIHPAAIEPDRGLERLESAVVRIPFEWNAGEPYRIGVTVGDGTRFERAVEAASASPEPTADLFAVFALVGTYVGVVPVLVGMLWLPFMARMRGGAYAFLLAFTAGLLLFLGIDAAEEAAAVSAESLAGGLNGLPLIATVAAASFLALHVAAGRMSGAGGAASAGEGAGDSAPGRGVGWGAGRPMALALMIAVGIGLHNLGEGLAIGAAVVLGQAALGAFLIVGFALHNTTEGVAIAAPVARAAGRGGGGGGGTGGIRAAVRLVPRLAALGAIAGVPAILGAWIGGFAYSPIAAIVFLSVGIGAIFQVAYAVLAWARSIGASGGRRGAYAFPGAPAAAGIALGMAVMYLTSVLV